MDLPFFLLGASQKLTIYLNLVARPGFDIHFSFLVKFIHVFIYLVLTLLVLRNFKKEMKQYYSSLHKVRMNWLHYLLFGFFIILAMYVLFYTLWITGNFIDSKIWRYLCVWEPVMLLILGYKGLVQPDLIFQADLLSSKEKYRQSKLSKSDSRQLSHKLLKLMEQEKPYLKSDLTLLQLADELGISHVFLSQVINQNLHQNFFDFINRYRVEEAKKILKSDRSRRSTILNVAFDVGFNSKSTFYKAFKKEMGITPVKFRKM
jgi:AraC-like DNA-binding protein